MNTSTHNKVKRAAKIIDAILTCKDFNSKVVFIYEDGSKFNLNHAFYIKLNVYVVIFTKHLGYYIFHEDEVFNVRQYLK